MTRFLRLALAGLLCAAPLATPAVLATAAHAAPVPKASDEELKAQILKLNAITDDDTATARLRELLKDKDAARRIAKLAQAMLSEDGKKKPLKYNAALICGKLAQFTKEFDAAEALYTFCLTSSAKLQAGDKIADSLEFLSQVYEEQKKYGAIEEVAQKLIDGADGEVPAGAMLAAYEKIILAKSKQGDTNAALDLADRLITTLKSPLPMLEVKARVYRDAGRYDDAVAAYEEVIKTAKADDRFDAEQKERIDLQMRYVITGVYVDAKQTAKAVKLLKDIVKEKPDVATYRNDLGFIMADANLELDRAETEVRKALELDKEMRAKLLDEGKIEESVAKQENAAYLDSLGWVLYRKGQFDEALKYLELAMRDPEEGNHIEIFDHVADCLLAVGKKDEAVSVWEKSLKLQDVSPRDVERRKKVTEKLKKARQ